jgi:hypothetical protein
LTCDNGSCGIASHCGHKTVRIDLLVVWGDRHKGVAKHVLGTPVAGAHEDHSDEARRPGTFMLGGLCPQGQVHCHPRSSGPSMFRAAGVVFFFFCFHLDNAVAVFVLSLP